MSKDPYQVLGISKSATQDEIKNAYRGLAKKFHPDLNPGNKTAEAKFKDAASAYEQIGTPEMRAKYDRGETDEQQAEQARRAYEQARAGQGAQGGEDQFYYNTQRGGGRYSSAFGQDMGGDDFFENLFRNGRGGTGGRRAQPTPEDLRGEDQLYQMEIDFKDAVLGAEKEITLPQGKKLKVKIPAGIESGAKLRFKNQGGPGMQSGPAGDAYVEIKVRPSTEFKRVGDDLETEVPISFIEALLGAEIQVHTIDGPVMLKVPSGVSTGSRLRIRGKGVASGKSRGDQIVALKVVTPKIVDPDLQAAIRSWEGKFSYNPRAEK